MTITWSPALAPLSRPLWDDEPEPLPCDSRLFLPSGSAHPSASLSCSYDAAHTGATTDTRHAHGLARWTTTEAAESFAAYLAAQGPRCSDCDRPAVVRGRCGMCASRDLAADDHETTEDDA